MMNEIEHQIITLLKRLKPEARIGALTAILQCIGPVSEECGEVLQNETIN